jgi:hypothetical protein
MSTVLFPARRRRALLLGVAVVLLHWMVLRWLGAQVAMPGERTFGAAPVELAARLLPPEPKPPAARPVVKRAPPALRPLKPIEAPPVEPPPVLESTAPLAELAPVPVPALSGDGSGDAQAGAAPDQADVQSASSAEPAAPSASRRYQADAPPSADIMLSVDRLDADGTHWTGEALFSWKRSGDSYRINIEAGIKLVFARVNLAVLTSEGTITDAGLAPQTMTEKRRGRAMTATLFNQQDGKITFSASENAYALVPGAQDKASIPMQLAAIARADPSQLSGNIDILVGEDRDASVFTFVVLGQEDIDTGMGKLKTWHLSRPPKPGSYHSRLDIWLAPALDWYPVQIRNTEASGAVTTQTVSSIVKTDTGS